jgi:peptide/nickel transport system substrate-binding protein
VPKPALAEEVTSNKDATKWTIRVKKGIQFHNGKTLDIDDVLFTFNRIVKNQLSGAAGLAFMNLKDARKLDSRTVEIPMKRGYSILPLSLVADGEMSIVPVGYNPKKPIGTGPFRMNTKKAYFSPGRESLFERNNHYWRSGEPYFDAVQITEYQDEDSQVNALESKQADCADQLSYASVAPLKNAGMVVKIWSGPGWIPFTMRLDKKPFNDVNVRNAIRYATDRELIRKEVFGGYGTIGNDVFGIDQPDYDKALPQRHYDPERAKSLLKKAGHDKLHVKLVTANIKTGATTMAQVLKQSAGPANIDISLDLVTGTVFFGPNYLKWTFAQDWWSGYPYLRQAGYSMVNGAPWDETHWNTSKYYSKYFKLYEEALKTVNAAKQADIVHEMMKMDWEEGGYIIPVFNPIIVGQDKKLSGAANQKTGDPWVQYQFRSLWFS